MNNSSSFKNVALIILALFSASALLRLTGVVTSPHVENTEPMVGPPTPPAPPPSAPVCDTCKNRYPSPEANGGMMISNPQFMAATSLYQNVINPIDIRTCNVFVTKRAIDYMINYNCNVNGLNCYFGMIKTPVGANKLTLILAPAYSSHTSFDHTTNPTSMLFESTTLCPDECGSNDTIGVCR